MKRIISSSIAVIILASSPSYVFSVTPSEEASERLRNAQRVESDTTEQSESARNTLPTCERIEVIASKQRERIEKVVDTLTKKRQELIKEQTERITARAEKLTKRMEERPYANDLFDTLYGLAGNERKQVVDAYKDALQAAAKDRNEKIKIAQDTYVDAIKTVRDKEAVSLEDGIKVARQAFDANLANTQKQCNDTRSFDIKEYKSGVKDARDILRSKVNGTLGSSIKSMRDERNTAIKVAQDEFSKKRTELRETFLADMKKEVDSATQGTVPSDVKDEEKTTSDESSTTE